VVCDGIDIGSCLFASVCVSSKYLSSSTLDAFRVPFFSLVYNFFTNLKWVFVEISPRTFLETAANLVNYYINFNHLDYSLV